ncbi:MAG TPA: exodeoxyribonuclease VII large subunit, partial [Burkholderiaceae bacterium]|nr:exodeoxyribonuclease VII large subunit [Burkholderiaceae bacterium]
MVEPNALPLGGRATWSVAGLVAAVGEALGTRFGACTVAGEISGFARAASGHCY